MRPHPLQRGLTFLRILAVVLAPGLALGLGLALSVYDDWHRRTRPCDFGSYYTICARVSELYLAGAFLKSTVAEGLRQHGSFAPAWTAAITLAPNAILAGGAVSPSGAIRVQGTAVVSHATITLTPSLANHQELTWTCKGEPAKYMPRSCR